MEPNENLKRLILALHALSRSRQAMAALQALGLANMLLTLFLFGQDYFGWWPSPLAPAADEGLVALMISMSLTLGGFMAVIASLYFTLPRRAPARTAQPRSRVFSLMFLPVTYGLTACWGHAYLTGDDPIFWGSLAVASAVAFQLVSFGLITREQFAASRKAPVRTVPRSEPPPAKRRAVWPLLKGIAWRRWWRITHPGSLRRLSPLDRSLFTAVARGDARSVAAYLSRGADPNLKVTYHVPLLNLAASKGHAEVARLLLEAGADSALKNAQGLTALEVARRRRQAVVIALLEKEQEARAKNESV